MSVPTQMLIVVKEKSFNFKFYAKKTFNNQKVHV